MTNHHVRQRTRDPVMPPEFIMRQRQKLQPILAELAGYWRLHQSGECGPKIRPVLVDDSAWRQPIVVVAVPFGFPLQQGNVHCDLITME